VVIRSLNVALLPASTRTSYCHNSDNVDKIVSGDSTGSGLHVLQNVSAIACNCKYSLAGASAKIRNCLERLLDAQAASFYSRLSQIGYDPDAHIDILPEHRLIYICVPKCASTTIKMLLSALVGQNAKVEHIHKRRYSGLQSPSRVSASVLHRIATDSGALRFSFGRDPYARLVSAWADKFRDKPLILGDPFIEKYLRHREALDASLPLGPDRSLTFSNFVTFATATAHQRLDAHWQLQDDILNMPGISLNYVGKVESFEKDFAPILNYLGAYELFKQMTVESLNKSQHRPWPQHYTTNLAARVYRAYERDFDRLGYARTIRE
jgi:hypothetical protein